eukprot:TRINITY_DN64797_c0_g1_i1.p1 TRINITY_DN64797_c0_g1~~TRINITY_DN64797_c0_g1_i1.p1  ORF type:complete len:232 (+),score=6.73 TRINITY_DN64797_c0_g1_i1:146-841(+)
MNWTAYLGSMFVKRPRGGRSGIVGGGDWLPHPAVYRSDFEFIGEFVIHACILPHLNDPNITEVKVGGQVAEKAAKFNFLQHCAHKLWDFHEGRIGEDNNDATSNQELVAPAQVINACAWMGLMQTWSEMQKYVNNHLKKAQIRKNFLEPETRCRTFAELLYTFKELESFPHNTHLVSTGNISAAALRPFFLPQAVGWCVVAERLNIYRLMSQLRSTHRGKHIEGLRSSLAC